MSANATLHARRVAAVPRGIGNAFPIYAERAEESEVWDTEGKRYIDFAGGIAVLNTGHRHPKVVAAVKAQLDRYTHTCFQVLPYEPYVELCEKLNKLAPFKGEAKTILFSTGAEAVENSIKIAKAHTGRPGVIAFAGAFHGRTTLGMALTGKVAPYRKKFGPTVPSVYHIPFPTAESGVTVADSLKALEFLFRADIEPTQVAAIIIEPVQGEGGFHPAPTELLEALRAICDQHGIVLIADEIQTGFARTGKMFAMEHFGARPDLMTLAKSMAGGTTLSAVCGRAAVMDGPAPGGLGGTYAGHPLAIAAAHAVLDVMEEEGLCARAQRLGDQLIATLIAKRAALKCIGDVRGLGAMVACEFVDPRTGAPDADTTKKVQMAALRRGLLLLTCGVNANVIRFLFPLTIEDAVFNEGLAVFDAALAEVVA